MPRSGLRVRFCNNPGCPRVDEHVQLREALERDGRHLCPACHEELVIQEARPRPPRLPGPGPGRTRAD